MIDLRVMKAVSGKATEAEWAEYCARTIAALKPLLAAREYALDEYQPHISGERFLTGPVSGGRKLVLIGKNKTTEKKVVIKASNEPKGIEELELERRYRKVLERSDWSSEAFRLPEEIAFIEQDGFAIIITEFIEQDGSFLDRPWQQQEGIMLAAFDAQEKAHATRNATSQIDPGTFTEISAAEYCNKIAQRSQNILGLIPQELPVWKKINDLTDTAIALLVKHEGELAKYGGFLTHWDFTPQNFRVREGQIYLLDHSSLHIGNKYEGFARLINFMVLHNPPLAETLIEYIRENRGAEELLVLKLMRVYRLVELIRYYANWLSKTEGSVHELAQIRIVFWTEILSFVLSDSPVPQETIEMYRQSRDRLRSEDEKLRQKGLH